MAQIAVELSQRGFEVSGSDIDFYEPMGSLLKSTKIKLFKGYEAKNITNDLDLVVIGNAVRRDNPEVVAMAKKKCAYTLFPKLFFELGISGKHSIVVAGTHGKSTTTGITASVLKGAENSPTYFVGGIINGFSSSLQCGSGAYSTVEGDEYDSAFFAKLPKFHFYKPDTLIITSIEFDHADIYPNLEAIENEFIKLIDNMPLNGQIIACIDCKNVERLVNTIWKEKNIISYGINKNAQYILENRTFENIGERRYQKVKSKSIEFYIPLLGSYNAKNALASYLACKAAGINEDKIKEGFLSFRGVKRRQEIIKNSNQLIVMDDFAHHPTAVKETLAGIQEAYPEYKIICAFEPRSNTSRRKVFQESYKTSFQCADIVVLSKVAARPGDENLELFSVEELSNGIQENEPKKEVHVCDGAQAVLGCLKRVIEGNNGKNLVVTMSNGAFGGISTSI